MANGADMKELLDRVEEEIAGVKRQYDLFFQGSRRSEPSDKRREVEETVRRMGQRKIVNSNDQFRFHSLQSRFYSLSNLWVRMIRDLEEGRLKRDPHGALARKTPPPPDPVDPAHIDRVIAELVEARKACGLPAGDEENLSATRETLLARAREISGRSGGRKVEFRICVDEGKPKVKARIC
ncbi:MAG TPA: MXAN_5187 C-terminal domain-containing protein [Candidatus Limnocylindrales bacterium]|nr:MXAN_5187 C-terminal domain-containing protein [Candidatus Limnocylindrales bacterium]